MIHGTIGDARGARRLVTSLAATAALSAIAHATQSGSCVAGLGAVAPLDAGADDWFGYDVDVDGDVAVVGSRLEDSAASDAGAVYVFRRPSGSWVQEVKLVGSDTASNDGFGYAVALDGDTLVVGAPFDDDHGNASGSAYAFVRSGGTWNEQAKLVPTSGAALDFFGMAVAIDGDVAVVGARNGDGLAVDSGTAHVFERTGTAWAEVAVLSLPDGIAGEDFGVAVAIQAERICVGAIDDGVGAMNVGSATVFDRVNGTWTLVQRLRPTGTANAQFGFAVSVDGARVFVGGPEETAAALQAGAVWIFVESGGAWSQEVRLEPLVLHDRDHFGASVDAKAGILVVGAWGVDVAANGAGAAYEFELGASGWSERALLTAPVADQAAMGWSSATDGVAVVVGAWGDDAYGSGSGSAWAFDVRPSLLVYCTAKQNSLGCWPSISWAGNPSLSGADDFRVTAAQVVNQTTGLLFWGSSPAAIPFQGGYKCIPAPTFRTPQQGSGGNVATLDCSGTFYYHFTNEYMTSRGLGGGDRFYCQYWMRDLGSPSGTGLSNALEVTICP